MTLDQFRRTLTDAAPPQSLTAPLRALWFDGNGDWNQAHSVAQDVEDATGAWVHAYLHRKEGDMRNAGGWYSRAGKTMPASPLQEEWDQLTTELLTHT